MNINKKSIDHLETIEVNNISYLNNVLMTFIGLHVYLICFYFRIFLF